ncbi:hypothetical protein H4R18_005130 [Coemansia javaensis]|uniref:FAD/NAD(P)-binding domain-containing protein n=1 Tax=Coemansia javaensis TaxID=2761396 RepID=A0A9W8LDU7_9FUNG|nr:hypothetical protein H4R18_005130 [Coemansia javaensis]
MNTVRILVAGGNYAGLSAVQHLYSTLLARAKPANVHVTMIDRRDGFVHYMGMTRGLTEPEYGKSLWMPYATTPWLSHPRITIRQATIAEIIPRSVRLACGESLDFDYLVIALGLGRFAPIGMRAATKDAFVQDLAASYAQLAAAKTVAVVGGGAVGIEMAADVKSDFPDKAVTLVHSRSSLLPGPFLDELRIATADALQNRLGVRLELGRRVVAQSPQSADMTCAPHDLPELAQATATDATLTLSDGATLHADWVVRCLGARSRAPLVSLPPSPDCPPVFGAGGIRVRPTMQVDDAQYPHIYACGDICNIEEVKLAGMAMYGGYIAARNIARTILHPERTDLDQAKPQPPRTLLLLGKDCSLLQKGDVLYSEKEARAFTEEDIGLQHCVDALSLTKTPDAATPYDTPKW